MVYIVNGQVVKDRPKGLNAIIEWFLTVWKVFLLFFRSLTSGGVEEYKEFGRKKGWGGDDPKGGRRPGDGGPGGGGGGGGRRGVSGMSDLKAANDHAAACGGGG